MTEDDLLSGVPEDIYDNPWVRDAIALLKQLATERARADKVAKALKRLVDLKDIKDKFGKNDWYLTEQPLAWEAARSAIDKAMKGEK